MEIATVLIASRNEEFLASVSTTMERFDNLQLEVVEQLADVEAKQQESPAILLFLHAHPGNLSEVRTTLRQLRSRFGLLPLVMLSEQLNREQEIEILRLGALDCMSAPIQEERLSFLVELLASTQRQRPRRAPSQQPFTKGIDPDEFADESPLMEQLMAQVRKVAPKDTTILLSGETGTGKTSMARVIHALSTRGKEPFQVIDCGALSGNLIESEMFGHVRGAFTGANRDHAGKFAAVGAGTLLLDEIDALPYPLQTKLLRAVDERVFEAVGSTKPQRLEARLIVATNRSLEQEVAAGRFRADLFYRLNVIGFYLPPLRERTQAIAPLARRFLAELSGRKGTALPVITPQTMQSLEQHPWPGNVRELRNAMERAIALCDGHEIHLHDLPDPIRRGTSIGSFGLRSPEVLTADATFENGWFEPSTAAVSTRNLAEIKEEAELARLIHALQKYGKSRKQVAEELGISRTALYNKLNKYGLGKQGRNGVNSEVKLEVGT